MTEEKSKKKRRIGSWIWLWVKRLIVGIILLWVLLTIAIQIPAVQQFVVNKITHSLSERTGTVIEAEGFRLRLFNELQLQGLYIEDHNGDTLLYSRDLNVSFDNPIYSYIRGRDFVVEGIHLGQSRLNHRQGKGDTQSNLESFMEAFSQASPSTDSIETNRSRPTLDIDLKMISLRDVQYVMTDSVQGSHQRFKVREGLIIPSRIDWAKNEIVIKDVILEHPEIELHRFPGTYIDMSDAPLVNEVPEDDLRAPPMLLKVGQVDIIEGAFILNNYINSPERTVSREVLDWQRIDFDEIFLDVSDFSLYDWNFDGCLNQLSGQSSSGFAIEDLRANYVHVDTQRVNLEGVQLETSGSNVNADIQLQYDSFPAFRNFVDDVEITFESRRADIRVADIIQFAPNLADVKFFRESRQQLVRLQGDITGPVNKLQGSSVYLELGEGTSLLGNFNSRNLSQGDDAYVRFEIQQSNSSVSDLQRIVPGVSPPDNFNNLGRLQFQGIFDGGFKNFSTNGRLISEIGRARMAMKMDVREGEEKAKYSGTLNLIDFDLGAWNSDADFGRVSLHAIVSNGQGLVLDALSARIQATVEGFSYKGYTFNNFNMNGTFNKALFDGKFDIADEFMNFSFRGKVDLEEELPQIDIDADIVQMHLKELQFTEDNLQLSGGIQLRITNYNINQLAGRVALQDFQVIQDDTIKHQLDTLTAYSRRIKDNRREIQLHSPQVDFSLVGEYKPTHLLPSFLNKFRHHHPEYADLLGVTYDSTLVSPQKFDLSVSIHDTERWLELLDSGLDSLYNSNAHLYWDDALDSIHMEAFTPHFRKGNQDLYDAYVFLDTRHGISNLVTYVDSASIADQYGLESFTGQFDFDKDSLYWSLNLLDAEREGDRLNLGGKSFIIDSNFAFQLLNRNLELFYENWSINPDNLVQINREFIRVEDFNMSFKNRTIGLSSIQDKGLSLNIENVELSLLNDILVSEDLHYEGNLSASVFKSNIYAVSALEGKLDIEDLLVNGDDYGTLDVRASSDLEDSPLQLEGGIIHPDHSMKFNGFLFASATGATDDFYALKVQMDRIPLHILTYFIEEGISGVEGHLTGKFDLSGEVNQPVLLGEGLVQDGAVTIDFLGIRIFIENQIVKSEKNFINASDARITDIYGNAATLKGGLTHEFFSDLGLNLQIQSDKFLLLNTTEDDGIMYYGHCMGSANVDMSGPLSSPTIDIDAENKENTRFYLRTDFVEEDITAGYFRFEDFSDTTEAEKTTIDAPTGINFSLDLKANDQAEVEIIIDKKTGDIIRGRGRGDIQFNLNPAGDITMFGNYEITRGQYLFTSQVVIQKPFTVAPGSTIRWTGEPLDAVIDIKAQYSVFTSPYFLVQEMVTQPDQIREFQNNTNVILNVNLTGMLYAPQLAFTIDFPNLTGSTKSIVENKLSLLESDPNEMYKQAGALIVLNTFVPSVAAGGQALGVAAGVNTLSEFVSSQFSNVLSDILRSAVEGVEFIDDIDLDLNYNIGTDDLLRGEGLGINTGEFRVSTTARLFDRVELDVGTNYYVGNTNTIGASESGTFFTGNFALQYALTEDRQLMLRVYSLSDQVLEGRRFRSGVGIRYQKEFHSFNSFYDGLQKTAQRLRMLPSDQEEDQEKDQ